MQNSRLGKGLSALLNTKISPKVENIEGDRFDYLSINLIDGNKDQPRKIFYDESLMELAESIKLNGVLQPIVVYKKDDRFIIVAGERRWRAAKIANLSHMPAVVKDISDKKILEIALVENIQRENLNSMDEAECYKDIMERFSCTQEDVASAVGKSRSYVANIVRLNDLPESVKQKIRDGIITSSKARSLIGLANAEEIADRIASEHLNAREVEEIIRSAKHKTEQQELVANKGNKLTRSSKVKTRSDIADDPHLQDLNIIAQMLMERFNVGVEFRKEENKYQLLFHLNDFEELDRILSKIS